MTDIPVTPANVTVDTASDVENDIAGNAVEPGDSIFIDGDKKVYLASANAADKPGKWEKFGLAVATAGVGQYVSYLSKSGDIIDFGDDILDPGKWYSVSRNAGKIKLANEVTLSVNEVQRLSVSGATSGTFTITFDGETTDAIAHGATAADVKSALEALPNIDLVDCTGGPLGSADVDIEFQGENAATNVAEITVTNSTDGTVTPSTVTEGVSGDHPRLLGFARSTRKLELFLKRVDEQV